MRRLFQEKPTIRAKALRQKHAQYVEGKARRPVWLKWTSQKGERESGKVKRVSRKIGWCEA